MQKVYPKPYITITAHDFGEVNFHIRSKEFTGAIYKPGRILISFQFCFFKKVIIENLEDIDFEDVSLSFTNCYIQEIQIEKIVSKNISINFHACLLSGRISAQELKLVSVNNCLLENSLFFLNVKKIQISYTTENIFPHWWGLLFVKKKIYNYKRVLNQIQRYHIENSTHVKISSSKKTGAIAGLYRRHHESNNRLRVGYKLHKEEEDLLKVMIYLKFSTEKIDEVTEIDNVDLNSLSLSGNPNGKVSIQNTRIGSLYLSEFSPKEDCSFYNLNPKELLNEETKISIHKCNLDKTWFDNVYFGEFQRLSFYRSKFSNAIFTSCSFPDDYSKYEKFLPVENVHYPENRTINHDKDQYEIFLQLKKALEATGNIYESLKLQSISHTALNKVNSISSADKMILSINEISNNHGLSIKKPFWWFLGISIFFYLAYLWSLNLIFQSTDFDPNLIGYYFSFIDITHRSNFLLEKSNLNGWALSIDYLNKILMGFLIYQFIASFRKYGKK